MNEIFQQAASLAWFDDSKGWPATVTPEQAIALQCRRLGSAWSEYTNHPDTREMTARVRAAVKAGALELTTTTEKKPTQQRRVISPGVNVRWGSGAEWPVQRRLPPPTEFKTVKTHHITAPAFAAWLALNKQEPARHVAAWFAAQGVNTAAAQPQAAAPATAKPVTLTRRALIEKYLPRWSTIEVDLSEASRNGLKDAANISHGVWDEQKALDWAESKGKLKDSSNVTAMASGWPGAGRVHIMKG